MTDKLRVIIESPLTAPTVELLRRNQEYTLQCIHDSIKRGEAPFAGHSIYPKVLDDKKQEERRLGITCHKTWVKVADLVAIYCDYGISSGMLEGIEEAERCGIPTERRKLYGDDTDT